MTMNFYSHLVFFLYNSVIAAIFCITVSILSTGYSSYLLKYQKLINKNIQQLNLRLSNETYIEKIDNILATNGNEIDKILSDIKDMENDYILIDVNDISSKVNLNFIDFTIFKEPLFKAMLKKKYNWISLQEFRTKAGFTGNINIYRSFFNDDVEFDNIFTIFSYPNINNASDIEMENFYLEITGNSSKANSFKEIISKYRSEKLTISKENYKKKFFGYYDDISDTISTIPSWNINYVNEKLLTAILSKYHINGSSILDRRNSVKILPKELKHLVNDTEKNRGLLTYIGTNTSFWEIIITNKNSDYITKLIIKWNLEQEIYDIISISQVNE